MDDRYIATMLLHAVGDTVGFKNGEWEFFSKKSYNEALEKLYEFIDLGGINNINLEGWNISDDTLLHMAIGESLLSSYASMEELNNTTVKNIVKTCDKIMIDDEHGKKRYIGTAVKKHYIMLKKGDDWKNFSFDYLGGGSGSAMRCNCIGLAFYGKENRSKLIQYAVDSGRMTHVNPIGWMGGVAVALFTSFAIENVPINKWVPLLLEVLSSDVIKKYVNMDKTEELHAYEVFIQAWKTYYEYRFSNGVPSKTKSHTNPVQRLVFYNNVFDTSLSGKEDMIGDKYGMSGYSVVIVAYDCLIDADNSWEKLVVYAMLNNFDSDTIGAIAGGLFGALYGFSGVPKNNIIHIENKETLIKIGNQLYKKFYKREKIN